MDSNFEVVVVGGGLAGLCACIECLSLSPYVSITLIEKQSKIGGVKCIVICNETTLSDDVGIHLMDRQFGKSDIWY